MEALLIFAALIVLRECVVWGWRWLTALLTPDD